uniref:Uncharacterized protein n=1 Tax=Panagrolaimus davidi TaxID=227884 RepID=A0A914Q8I4_9BILA
MSIPLLAFISIIVGFLFLVSKQRRRRGLPPLPLIGQLFEAILDAEDQLTGAKTTNNSGAQNTITDEIPRPVAVLKNDVGDFMAYHKFED